MPASGVLFGYLMTRSTDDETRNDFFLAWANRPAGLATFINQDIPLSFVGSSWMNLILMLVLVSLSLPEYL